MRTTVAVAPQLTVVPAPPLNEAFEHMRGTPTLLGWRPTRRRYVIRQQCSHTPTMIGDPSGHSRCPLPTPQPGPRGGEAQTRMWRTEVVDGTNQIHTVLQRQCAACERSASAGQRRQALPEG